MTLVSIIVPARNEAGNIGELLNNIEIALVGYDYEIVVVDEGSTDSTQQIVDDKALDNERIVPMHKIAGKGFGCAIKAGFEKSTGDVVIPMMGDLSDDPRDIQAMVKKIEEGYDVVYGSRFIEGGALDDYPLQKMVANRVFNNTVKMLFGIRENDVSNAFKAYRREVIDTVMLDGNGFEVVIELPIKAYMAGFRSTEVPVTWHGRTAGDAKVKLSKIGPKYLCMIAGLFFGGLAGSMKRLACSAGGVSKGRVAALGLLGALMLLGLSKFTDFTLKGISTGYLLIAVAVIMVATLLRVWRWDMLLKVCGHNVHKDTLFKSMMFGLMMNFVLPARAGDVASGAVLKAVEKTPMGISLTTIVVERIMDMLSLATLMVMGIAWLGVAQGLEWLIVGALAVAGVIIVGVGVVIKYDWVLPKLAGKRFENVEGFVATMKDGIGMMWKSPTVIVAVFGISVLAWLLEVVVLYIVAIGVGYEIGFGTAIIGGITAFLSMTVPITMANAGIYEGAMAGALNLFGVPLSEGVGIGLVDHFVRVGVVVFFGLISMIHLGFAYGRINK